MVVHAYNSSFLGGKGKRIVNLRPSWAKGVSDTVSHKHKNTRASMCKALGSVSAQPKKGNIAYFRYHI
jgi:hypothetical protein